MAWRRRKYRSGWSWLRMFSRDPFAREGGFWKRVRRITLLTVLLLLLSPPTFVAVYRDVAPPVTPLMVLRLFEGEGLKKTWIPIERISPDVARAVIALEDNLFCEHGGFDWGAIFEAAADQARGTGGVRGGSTISQQTAKNVFLWPGRSFLRKAIEVPFTGMVEYYWSKRRIMEVYLNVIEWGPGIYGVEAASQAYFRKPASALSRREAALLAAVLPNPRIWSPARPTRYIVRRANLAVYRIRELGAHQFRCLR